MAWSLIGGAALCLAPCAGAAVVWCLLALHEVRAGAGRLRQHQPGRHAVAGSFDEHLPGGEQAARPTGRPAMLPGVQARRADPSLLYQHLASRRPRVVRQARPAFDASAGRTARPTRLVPLTA
jgi:hypothetical protein